MMGSLLRYQSIDLLFHNQQVVESFISWYNSISTTQNRSKSFSSGLPKVGIYLSENFGTKLTVRTGPLIQTIHAFLTSFAGEIPVHSPFPLPYSVA